MSSSINLNYNWNKSAVKKYRKELHTMFLDIENIDMIVLNKAVDEGVKMARKKTPVNAIGNIIDYATNDGTQVNLTTTGDNIMRESWFTSSAVKFKSVGVTKSIINTADYAEYVNYGYRIVQDGKDMGWEPGLFILEKAVSHTEKVMKEVFQKEVERVNKEHDK